MTRGRGPWALWGWLALAAACGGSTPTTPATPPSPPPPSPPSVTTAARVTDVLTSDPLGGVAAAGSGISGGPSSTTGALTVGASAPDSAARLVTFSVAGYVARQVAIRIPGADVTVSMIPSGFNLTAFDELLRVTRLQRWTSAPPLRVQARTLQFTSVNAADAVGIDEAMSEQDLADLEADLSWALPQLTGQAFSAFAGITRETVAVDGRMQILNTGAITVARYAGLTAGTGYWGYSRWQFRADGTVIGGTIMLDRDFDRSGSVYRRSLRAHELGHALGYTHVSGSGLSVMHPAAVLEPTLFDRQATLIAFRRPPGNVRPDTDPPDASVNTASAGAIWSVGAGAPTGSRDRGPVR